MVCPSTVTSDYLRQRVCRFFLPFGCSISASSFFLARPPCVSHSYHYEDGGISRPLGKRKADDDLMPRITAKGLKAGRKGERAKVVCLF